jgi:hypothetical protein
MLNIARLLASFVRMQRAIHCENALCSSWNTGFIYRENAFVYLNDLKVKLQFEKSPKTMLRSL